MKRRALGTSMVSMMVGLGVSTVTVLAMMTLYKNVITQSMGTTGSNGTVARARDEGQVSTALLALQMELQRAGFGIGASGSPGVVNTDLVLVTGATWTASGQTLGGNVQTIGTAAATNVNANALIWDYNLTPTTGVTTIQCAGLVVSGGGLVLLTTATSTACASTNAAAVRTNATWNKVADLVTSGTLTTSTTVPTFQVINQNSCWPYGATALTNAAGTGATAALVGVTLRPTAATGYVANSSSAASICLPNLR